MKSKRMSWAVPLAYMGGRLKYLRIWWETMKARGHLEDLDVDRKVIINPYPTAFPYGNGTVLHFYQQQESSTTKTVHKVINKGLKTYV